jgi:hypothetical protein
MVYDRDLKWVAFAIVALLVGNAAGAIVAAFRRQWWDCAAGLLWCANILLWQRLNQNLQRQRDRNRVIEAAIMKVLVGDRLD